MDRSTLTDEQLARHATSGDGEAVEALLRRHQAFIYRLCLRFFWLPADAEDATQEILVKAFTHLGSFRGEARFSTWLYRIAVNQLLGMRRRAGESRVTSFSGYAEAINGCPDEPPPQQHELETEASVVVREAMESCISGMLLCLDRRQRMVFVLGALGYPGAEAADLLELTPANYRQLLKRARDELRAFMDGQCGLINPAAPCRCAKKTRAFIRVGIVDPNHLKFNPAHRRFAQDQASRLAEEPDGWLRLFQLPHSDPTPDFASAIRRVIDQRTH